MVVGLGFTIRQLALTTHQLDMLKKTNIDLHDWNRRKAAQKAIDDMVPRIASDTPLLDHTFHILTNNGATIPLETIEKACENNKSVRLAIHQRLDWFESLASGVQQGVFDEEVIKNYYQHLIADTYAHFEEYILQRRKSERAKTIWMDLEGMWMDLEGMNERWCKQDKEKPARSKTGHAPTTIRASKTRGG